MTLWNWWPLCWRWTLEKCKTDCRGLLVELVKEQLLHASARREISDLKETITRLVEGK